MINIHKARECAISAYREMINRGNLSQDLVWAMVESLELMERNERRDKRRVEQVIAHQNLSAAQSEWRVQ